jgi:hypothetical protein
MQEVELLLGRVIGLAFSQEKNLLQHFMVHIASKTILKNIIIV